MQAFCSRGATSVESCQGPVEGGCCHTSSSYTPREASSATPHDAASALRLQDAPFEFPLQLLWIPALLQSINDSNGEECVCQNGRRSLIPHRSAAGVEVWKAHGIECLCLTQIQVKVAAFPPRGGRGGTRVADARVVPHPAASRAHQSPAPPAPSPAVPAWLPPASAPALA